MYKTIKGEYWWPGKKPKIAEFVAQYLVCQQMKAEHQQSSWLFQPLPIPEWKWEHVIMDFVVGFPRSPQGLDAVWVIVDHLIKSTHFLAIHTKYSLEKFIRLYVDEIIRFHGVLVLIVSDCDPRFTLQFWLKFQ